MAVHAARAMFFCAETRSSFVDCLGIVTLLRYPGNNWKVPFVWILAKASIDANVVAKNNERGKKRYVGALSADGFARGMHGTVLVRTLAHSHGEQAGVIEFISTKQTDIARNDSLAFCVGMALIYH